MIKIEADFDELTAFTEKVNQLANGEWDRMIRDSLAEVAETYLQELIHVTPVKTGKLKGQWRKDNGNDLAVKVRDVDDGYVIELINTTEYASWVEKGHNIYNQFGGPYGWCYGRFFVTKTEVSWQNGKLDDRLQRRINKWMKSFWG